MKWLKQISILLTGFLYITCTSLPVKEDLVTADKKETQRLLSVIEAINSNRPQTLFSEVFVKIYADRRKFSVKGTLEYNAEPIQLRLKLSDPILRMLVADLYMDTSGLKTFIPLDNTVYVKRTSSVRFGKIGFDPYFISNTAIGIIPLIRTPYDIKTFTEKTESKDKYSIITFENSENSESITFLNDIPQKVEIVYKQTGKKLNVIYSDYTISDTIKFFGEIRAVSEPDGENFNIEFKNTKFNVKINERSFIYTVPKGIKITESL
jgi:hypothetical protein